MKSLLIVLMFFSLSVSSQELPASVENHLELTAEKNDVVMQDDEDIAEMAMLMQSKVNLNGNSLDDLKALGWITAQHIEAIVSYRDIFGDFRNIYELQAVPGWDIQTIRKTISYLTVSSNVHLSLKKFLMKGDNLFTLRVMRTLQKSRGFGKDTSAARYIGDPFKILLKYRLRYRNNFQIGFTGEKDAGESFLKGRVKGFDFNSFHLLWRDGKGNLSLIVGDFIVNAGQGLVSWQGMSFSKSADITSIRQQSEVVRPYTSAGEFNFNRGIAVNMKEKNLQAGIYVSMKKVDGLTIEDSAGIFVRTVSESGLHRTREEIAARKNLRFVSAGGYIQKNLSRLSLSLQAVMQRAPFPFQQKQDVYRAFDNIHSVSVNLSSGFSYTLKNIHVFGELGTDKQLNMAMLLGLIASLDRSIDISLLYRSADKSYQAKNASGFFENTAVSNEKGFYAGISLRPFSGIRIEAYTDAFMFPWLKYQVDAPSRGMEWLLKITYLPLRNTEIYFRYRGMISQKNSLNNLLPVNFISNEYKSNARFHLSHKLSGSITVRHRAECTFLSGNRQAEGFMIYSDVIVKPLMARWSSVFRVQYFQTDDYSSRIYSFENDMEYAQSMFGAYGAGCRYFMVCNYDLTRKATISLKWAETIVDGQATIGTGWDEIKGNRRSELKLQLRMIF